MNYMLEAWSTGFLGGLFPLLVLLYFVDCVAYVGDHHLLFSSHLGSRFKLKKPGLHLVGLLPTGQAFVSRNLPILLTSRGIYTLRHKHYTEEPRYKAQNLRFVAYEDVVKIEADGKVMRINGDVAVKFSSSANAKQATQMIRALARSEPSGRHERIRVFLEKAFDLDEIRALRQKNWRLTYVEILSSVLFIIVFGVLPLVLYASEFVHISLWLVLLESVCVYVLLLIVSYGARRETTGTTTGQTILAMLPAVLSPVGAMHMVKDLTKEMYARFDYVALAAVLLPRDAFERAVREEVLRVAYAKQEKDEAELAEFWSIRENAVRRLLAEAGIGEKELLAAPKRQDPEAAKYCPLCQSEYTSRADRCGDCGIRLKEFDAAPVESAG